MKNEIEKIIVNHIDRKISLGEATTQILRLFAVSGAKRKVCPVCKKTFEKGWGEFCSQDCWDTDM